MSSTTLTTSAGTADTALAPLAAAASRTSPTTASRRCDVLLLDGGLSERLSELVAPGKLHPTLWSAALLADPSNLALIAVAHAEFLAAGVDVIETVGYQATVKGFIDASLATDHTEAAEFLRAAEHIARHAINNHAGTDAAWRRAKRRQDPDRCQLWEQPGQILALSVGPYGAFLADGSEYRGNYDGVSRDELRAFHESKLDIILRRPPQAGRPTGPSNSDKSRANRPLPDVVVAFETFPNSDEAAVVCEIMQRKFCDTPFWLSFQCRDAATIASGESLAASCAAVLAAAGVTGADARGCSCRCREAADDAATTAAPGRAHLVGIGINCCHPIDTPTAVRTVSGAIPAWMETIAYPNKGEAWDSDTHTWSALGHGGGNPLGDTSIGAAVSEWASAGATIVGGCCRVGPAESAQMRTAVDAHNNHTTTAGVDLGHGR